MTELRKTVALKQPILDLEGRERLVGAIEVGKHIGFSDKTVLSMARNGEIPAIPFCHGSRTMYRFRLSDVDASLISSTLSTPPK
jgi:hypothetical protein